MYRKDQEQKKKKKKLKNMYFACEKAQAREPFWPESHQSNQEQQVSHTF